MSKQSENYDLSKAMNREEFMALPQAYQRRYLTLLGQNFGIGVEHLSLLFDMRLKPLYQWLKDNNMQSVLDETRMVSRVPFDKTKWEQFCIGATSMPNAPVITSEAASDNTKQDGDSIPAIVATPPITLKRSEITKGIKLIQNECGITSRKMASLLGVSFNIFSNYTYNRAIAPEKADLIAKNYMAMKDLPPKDIEALSKASETEDAITLLGKMEQRKESSDGDFVTTDEKKRGPRSSKDAGEKRARREKRKVFIHAIEDLSKMRGVHVAEIASSFGIDFQSMSDYLSGKEVSQSVEKKIADGLIAANNEENAKASVRHTEEKQPTAPPKDNKQQTNPGVELSLTGDLSTVVSALTAIYGTTPTKVFTVNLTIQA